MAAKDESRLIPDELFYALSILIGRLLYICEHECGLPPIELLTAWHIKHVGKIDRDGSPVVRRDEITRMLREKFGYSSTDVVRLLDSLGNKHLIKRTHLIATEQIELFGQRTPAAVVSLRKEGLDKIEDFKTNIRTRADRWVSQRGSPTRSAIAHAIPLSKKLAQWIIKRYEPTGEKRSS